jgi:hypothetical protein
MTSDTSIPKNARLFTTIGSVMFLGLGVAVAVLSWSGGEPRMQWESIPGSLALGGIVALPGLVAAIAIRRNDPRLLWPAIVAGLLPAAVTILTVGLVLVIPVLLFVQASMRWPNPEPSRSWRKDLRLLAIPALAIAAGLTFFVHQDPACWDYAADPNGRVSYTRTDAHVGMQSGWFSGWGTVTPLAVDAPAGEGSGSVCVSDRITPLEGVIALGLLGTAGAFALGAPHPRRADPVGDANQRAD